MHQLLWNLFAATGNIEAYLLYKTYTRLEQGVGEPAEGGEGEKEEALSLPLGQ